MFMLRTIERPTNATTRPDSAAASMTCCTRCTCEAKQATITRPRAFAITSATTLPTSRSDGMNPGTSALVESASSRSTPSSPRRENPGRSVSRPSNGVWSILKSPVCSTVCAPTRIATASASGIEWLTAKNSSPHGPTDVVSPSTTRRISGWMWCWSSFDATSASVEPRADQRDVGPFAQQVGQRADVVLVAVGQHDGVDVGQPLAVVGPVGQRQVDPGRVGLAEQHAAVDDEQPRPLSGGVYSNIVMLRPISLMPPSGTTRSAPGASGGGGCRRGRLAASVTSSRLAGCAWQRRFGIRQCAGAA